MSSSSTSTPDPKKAVLIFLHGLGDQGSSWEGELRTMVQSHIECICPTAPNQPVTLCFGLPMNAWFDLWSLDPNDPEDQEGIEAATKKIHDIIAEQERLGVSHDRIMLGGFSQGGALALYAGLTYPKKLAGVIALSCWLPLHGKFPEAAPEDSKNTPVLQCHGDGDFIVPYHLGQATEKVLSTFLDSNQYEFKTYPGMVHSTSTEEMNYVLDFIRKHLPSRN